ncbi:hypothetical protein F2Q69_00059448 [Brassica cretica]|uniref:Uncharacterized protein n=1 Tax=Brassica cretica TaxID=69181 RepID=A0A8S9RF47_BRACR|nr:hypothetical protein F2Q69_00059448 [Brassica cretica]
MRSLIPVTSEISPARSFATNLSPRTLQFMVECPLVWLRRNPGPQRKFGFPGFLPITEIDDDRNNPQTRDGITASDNVNQTPAANVNFGANTAALDELKKMFTAFLRKSEKHDKVMGRPSALRRNPGPQRKFGFPGFLPITEIDDDRNKPQTRDGITASDNVNQTPATNVNFGTNTAALDEFKKMFTAFLRKSEEHDKVMGRPSALRRNPGPQRKFGFPGFLPITEIDGVNFGFHNLLLEGGGVWILTRSHKMLGQYFYRRQEQATNSRRHNRQRQR